SGGILGDGGLAIRGRGGESGRDDPLSGTLVQGISRYGITSGDVTRIERAVLSGRRRRCVNGGTGPERYERRSRESESPGETGAGGNRRTRSLSRNCIRNGLPASRRRALGHGICWVFDYPRAATEGAFHPYQWSGIKRKP